MKEGYEESMDIPPRRIVKSTKFKDAKDLAFPCMIAKWLGRFLSYFSSPSLT